jgi:SAM-dependent methyltransferase
MHLWSNEKYQSDIYNDQYHLCDTPFLGERPRKLAKWLTSILPPCEVIDFGGGDGQLSALLNNCGFRSTSYDPFYGHHELPNSRADVVTAFEVVEHVPTQVSFFKSLRSLCKPYGKIIFTTLLKERRLNGDWWYASPRNGHVSFHTTASLSSAASQAGLSVVSITNEIHIASTDEIDLTEVFQWAALQLNDVPSYSFKDGWQEMVLSKKSTAGTRNSQGG